jgi:hypothetical protein
MASIDETENPVDSQPGAEDEPLDTTAPEDAYILGEGARSDLIWNGLTTLVWVGILFIAVWYGLLYSRRDHPLYLFQPSPVAQVLLPGQTEAAPTAAVAATEAASPVLIEPVGTPIPRSLEPTWRVTTIATATAATGANATAAAASATVTPTNTPGPSPTRTLYSVYPFVVRSDPKVLDASTFAGHDTCKLWVAGQTFNLQGAPMVGITVMLGGYLDGRLYQELTLTGTALQYGQAGYEFTIRDQPMKSKEALWVMLFDQSMAPLSGKIYFDTHADCDENLVVINFKQVR